jgi:hypothetical protein
MKQIKKKPLWGPKGVSSKSLKEVYRRFRLLSDRKAMERTKWRAQRRDYDWAFGGGDD